MTVAPVPGNGPSLFQARRTGLCVIKLQLNCHDKGTQREPSGRRERFEILKIVQGLGDGVAAVDKCPLRPLRPNGFSGRSKKASLVAIAKVVCGRPSSTFFGLGAGSAIRRQALTKDEARRITANVAKLLEPVAPILNELCALVRCCGCKVLVLSPSLAQRSTSRRRSSFSASR